MLLAREHADAIFAMGQSGSFFLHFWNANDLRGLAEPPAVRPTQRALRVPQRWGVRGLRAEGSLSYD